jgi:hypothetical protein
MWQEAADEERDGARTRATNRHRTQPEGNTRINTKTKAGTPRADYGANTRKPRTRQRLSRIRAASSSFCIVSLSCVAVVWFVLYSRGFLQPLRCPPCLRCCCVVRLVFALPPPASALVTMRALRALRLCARPFFRIFSCRRAHRTHTRCFSTSGCPRRGVFVVQGALSPALLPACPVSSPW